MSNKIPEATIEEILKRTDIVDLISDYLSLKQAGKDYLGLCPFHNEKTPSFRLVLKNSCITVLDVARGVMQLNL